jgi:phosphopantetheinyl transferase
MIHVILTPLTTKIHPKGFSKTFVDAFLKLSGQTSSLLSYDLNGSPTLNDGRYISIAHKDEVLVFVISEHKVGVDIERNTPPSKQLIDAYALNPFTPVKDWCMKEAYFKMTQDRQYDKVMIPKLSMPHLEIKYDPYFILVLIEDYDDVKIDIFDGETIRPLPM